MRQLDIHVRAQPGRRHRDFVIIGQPRSGTHMLATALDNHADVSVHDFSGTDAEPLFKPSPGAVVGEIVHALGHLEAIAYRKAIVLIRNSSHVYFSQRAYALDRPAHILRGEPIYPSEPLKANSTIRIGQNTREMIRFAKDTSALLVSYEDLCGGKDVTEFDQPTSFRLCRYLGVDDCVLRPETKKVSNA